MKRLENLGIAPVVATLIISLVSTGLKMGYSYYQSVQYAKEQAKIQRELQETELAYIANQLSMQTDIPFSQWYTVVKMTFNMPVITPPEPQPEPEKDNTIIYIVFAVLGILIITKGN